jgi:hypothetical protein
MKYTGSIVLSSFRSLLIKPVFHYTLKHSSASIMLLPLWHFPTVTPIRGLADYEVSCPSNVVYLLFSRPFTRGRAPIWHYIMERYHYQNRPGAAAGGSTWNWLRSWAAPARKSPHERDAGIHEMLQCPALLLLQRRPNAEAQKSFLKRLFMYLSRVWEEPKRRWSGLA